VRTRTDECRYDVYVRVCVYFSVSVSFSASIPDTVYVCVCVCTQAEREIFDDAMTHCAQCSPGFARLVQRALQENKADLYESAEAMLKDNDMHEAIKSFDADMQKAIEAQNAMMKELLDEHAHALGKLQMENEQCKQQLVAEQEQLSVHDISDDEEDSESISVRETRLLQEAEAGRVKLANEMDAMAGAQAEVKRQLLVRHQQGRMRMEETMRIDFAEWTRMEQQMRTDVNEFETKVSAERERRNGNPKKLSEVARQALIELQETKLKQMVLDEEKKRIEEEEDLRTKVADRQREKQERMSEFEKRIEAVFTEDAVLPAARKLDVREGRQARMLDLQRDLEAVFSSDCISLAASVVAGGAEILEQAVDAASEQEDLQGTNDGFSQQESEEGGAGTGGGTVRMEKQSERMLEFHKQLAAVFTDDPISLLTPRKHSISLATSGGEEAGSVSERGEMVDVGTTEEHFEPELLQKFPQSLQQQPSHQEALVTKAFVAVLPYTTDEFTADLHLTYRQAVADTACVGIDQVFFFLTLSLPLVM